MTAMNQTATYQLFKENRDAQKVVSNIKQANNSVIQIKMI